MIAPGSEADLAEAVAGASGPLAVRGGGTRPVGGPVAGEALCTAGIAGVALYEPAALTLVVRAGTALAEVEALLAAEGQRLAFEPMDHRALLGTRGVPTIGGVVAGNVSGSRRIQAGACRDAVLGLRFVDGRGQVLKSGGRVMKNVTGYDLAKLLCGSRGTLGVITEVAFKVLPRPEAVATLRIAGLADAAAVAAMAAAVGAPCEVTGAAHLPAAAGGPETLIRIDGFAASVAYRADRLCALIGGESAVETDPGVQAALWAGVRDVAPFAGRPGDVWRVSVRPSDGPRVSGAVPEAEALFDWGGGLVWLLVPPGSDLRAALAGIPGHATRVRAAPGTRPAGPAFPPEPAAVAALSAGLRAEFDPRGILNPGLMG